MNIRYDHLPVLYTDSTGVVPIMRLCDVLNLKQDFEFRRDVLARGSLVDRGLQIDWDFMSETEGPFSVGIDFDDSVFSSAFLMGVELPRSSDRLAIIMYGRFEFGLDEFGPLLELREPSDPPWLEERRRLPRPGQKPIKGHTRQNRPKYKS